jgi:thiol-disulfide isomerase/thioredoxin
MADWFDGTSVKLLKGSDFDDKEPWRLRQDRCAFVLFFADWCGHCKDFKPEYIKFADIAQFIRVRAVDTDSEQTLMERLGQQGPVKIEGFPTVWIYRQGEPYKEYNGPRTWQALLKEAKRVCSEKCDCDK